MHVIDWLQILTCVSDSTQISILTSFSDQKSNARKLIIHEPKGKHIFCTSYFWLHTSLLAVLHETVWHHPVHVKCRKHPLEQSPSYFTKRPKYLVTDGSSSGLYFYLVFFFFLNKFLPSFSLLMRPSQVPLLKRAVIAFSALTLHLPIIYALAVSCNNNNYNIKFHSQIKHDHAAVRLPNAEKHASHTLRRPL